MLRDSGGAVGIFLGAGFGYKGCHVRFGRHHGIVQVFVGGIRWQVVEMNDARV